MMRKLVTAVVSSLVAAAAVAVINRLWDRRRRKGAFVPD
jgi:4-hydroxybenzoate polyprenyltransferase